jgi:hypothetical protein
MAAVGRISGPLLKANLVRDGIDLAFETDLLYLDVNNRRIGIKTDSPSYELEVVGTIRTTDLIVDNQATIGNLIISNNDIESSTEINFNTAIGDAVIVTGRLEINDIFFENNTISTVNNDTDLRITTTGEGIVRIFSDTVLEKNLTVKEDVQIDGNTILGSSSSDLVTFNSRINTDIVPDQDDQHSLGTSDFRWNNVWVNNLVATNIETGDLTIDGVDLSLRQGNIYFVSVNGNDLKTGTHLNDPFRSLKKALETANSGDTIHIFPGVYEEIFPLELPVGVTVKGHGIRSVFVKPTEATKFQDAFLLNGETTIEDLTVGHFFYDAINNTGYAFRFAQNFTVTTRSPYIRNISVLTEGSNKLPNDPRSFLTGDAGRGAFLDGSIATSQSKEASGLFHSVTFITPGVDAVILTNGVRVEWLNCFTYFANRSIYAIDGATGLKGQGSTELRVTNVTGSFQAGETIEYYDFDGTTILATATIDSVSVDGKIFVSGKVLGFELPTQRSGKNVQAFGDAKLSTSIRKFGTASLSLDGDGDYAFVQSNNDFAFGTGDFTVEGWVYRSVSGSQRNIFDFRTTSPQSVPLVGVSSAGLPFYNVDGSSVIVGAVAAPVGEWFHLAASRQGTETRLFLNGVQAGSTFTDNTDYQPAPLHIGARWDGTIALNGFIDDVRVIKGTAVYTANFTPPISQLPSTSDTVLLLRFDGEDGSTNFVDSTVYDQDIRFSGSATATRFSLVDYTDFGAEVRLIASASVYGNFGLVGDGSGVIMYAIGHNVAYIGSGKDSDNDPANVVQAQEIIQENGARIYYSTVDHKGDYRVGDLFYVNQQDGSVQFTGADFNIDTTAGITLTDGVNTTFIDGSQVQTGNWKISGNTIETLTGDANFTSASNEINLNNNVNVDGDLSVTGNVTITGNIQIGDETTDTIEIVARVGSDIIPEANEVYSLGSTDLRWNTIWVGEVRSDSIRIDNNIIETVETDTDLILRADGTGIISIPTNDVVIDQDLTVQGATTLNSLVTIGTITHTGDVFQTGDFNITGDIDVTGTLTVTSTAQFEDIRIDQNVITTTVTDSDLILRANSTGIISIPDNDLVLEQNLTVNGTVFATELEVQTSVTADSFTTGDIVISNNVVETTLPESDLILRADGTGIISIPTNDVVIDQDLTVNGTTTLNDVEITGTITHTGDVFQTGNTDLTGDLSVIGTIDVSGSAQFEDIRIDQNVITTTVQNSNLVLSANGTGSVVIPNNDVLLNQDLTVLGNSNFENLTATSTITANEFFTGDIRIFDNIIETTLPNSDLLLSANGTRSVVIEDISITDNVISTSTDLILETDVGKVIKFESTESITIPVGTTAERPNPAEAGMLRFNTDTEEYEGYNGTNWIRLRGVYDEDEDTFITAELTPGANDNNIRFYAGGNEVADINQTRFNTSTIDVGDIRIFGNTIETVTPGQNLELKAQGQNASVIIENFAFNQNIITNIIPDSITEFNQAGNGYFKIDSSRGFVVPVGTSSQRPSQPVLGLTRYNTELEFIEVYDGTQWVSVAGAAGAINAAVANDIAVEIVLMLG